MLKLRFEIVLLEYLACNLHATFPKVEIFLTFPDWRHLREPVYRIVIKTKCYCLLMLNM